MGLQSGSFSGRPPSLTCTTAHNPAMQVRCQAGRGCPLLHAQLINIDAALSLSCSPHPHHADAKPPTTSQPASGWCPIRGGGSAFSCAHSWNASQVSSTRSRSLALRSTSACTAARAPAFVIGNQQQKQQRHWRDSGCNAGTVYQQVRTFRLDLACQSFAVPPLLGSAQEPDPAFSSTQRNSLAGTQLFNPTIPRTCSLDLRHHQPVCEPPAVNVGDVQQRSNGSQP